MSLSGATTEGTRKEGLFRFGQPFSSENVKFRYYRDAITRFICVRIPDESLGNGLDVFKRGTEELVEWIDDYRTEEAKHWKEFKNSMYLHERNGNALDTFIKLKNEWYNFSYATNSYELDYDKDTTLPVKGKIDHIVHNVPQSTTWKIPDDVKLEQLREIITFRKESFNEGLPSIEPAWDLITSLYILISHLSYAMSKYGGGLTKTKIPASVIEDGVEFSALQKAHSNFWSIYNSIIEISHIDGIEGKEITTEQVAVSGTFDWAMALDVLFTQLSIITSIPVAILKGITPGQLEGAEVNQSDYFDALEDYQEGKKQDAQWFAEFICKKILGKQEEIDIGFTVRRDQSKQIIEKLNTFQDLTGRKIKPKVVAQFLGLEIDETQLEEKVEMTMMEDGINPEEQDEEGEEQPDDTRPNPNEKNGEDE